VRPRKGIDVETFAFGFFVGCYFGFLGSLFIAHVVNRPPSKERIRQWLEEDSIDDRHDTAPVDPHSLKAGAL